MFSFFTNLWRMISYTGIRFAHTEREKRELIDLNRGLIILLLIQVLSLASHIANGLHRSALMTVVFIAGLALIRLLVWKGHVNIAKISSITLINYNTVSMAVFLGEHTHVIDFLLLTALLPLYFFEMKNKRLIFCGVALSIVPFAVYYFLSPYLSTYGVPIAEQLVVNKTTEPVKFFCLVVLLYLIYHKNSRYELEAQEKEEQLIGQKKLYERLLEQIPIDIVTFDKELRYSYINSAAISDPVMRKWMIGKTNQDYFRERGLNINGATERDKILHEALEKGTALQMEESFLDRNGKLCHTLKGASPIYNENKELLCLVGYSLDITSMKEADEQLKEYARELERKNDDLKHFVYATSHDLKSPLRNITSYLQLLARRNAGKLDEDSVSMIGHAINAVKHLNQLIRDIYQYSVADQNDKPTELTNLNTVLEEVIKNAGDTIFKKNAAVQHSTLPKVYVAPAHMNMLLSNLVENALKYNKSPHPQVRVDCLENENEYIVSVADNGIGISERYNKQIFEIFKRLHNASQYEGTGVGLAICNKIVGNYGGKMWVESEPDKGSIFYFSLAKKAVDRKGNADFKMETEVFDEIAKAS